MITNETSDNYAEDWGIVNVNNPAVSDHHAVWAEFYTLAKWYNLQKINLFIIFV